MKIKLVTCYPIDKTKNDISTKVFITKWQAILYGMIEYWPQDKEFIVEEEYWTGSNVIGGIQVWSIFFLRGIKTLFKAII